MKFARTSPAMIFRRPICSAGGSELAAASLQQSWNRLTTLPAGAVFSSNDYLFTSGTLGRYCSKLTSTQRGKREAVEFITQHPVLVVSLVKIAVLLFVVMTALAYLTWFERKVVAHIQSRWGPYFVGAHGLLQPLADGLKFLFKEDMTPPASDKFVYILAPFLALALALTAIALIPFGPPIVQRARPAGVRRRQSRYRPAVPFRRHFHGRLRRGPRRMVLQQQISAARRPAQLRADDQL